LSYGITSVRIKHQQHDFSSWNCHLNIGGGLTRKTIYSSNAKAAFFSTFLCYHDLTRTANFAGAKRFLSSPISGFR